MRVPLPAAMITMSSAMRLPSNDKTSIIGRPDCVGVASRRDPASSPAGADGNFGAARRALAGLLLLCLTLLSGCSLLRLTYPQVPTIAYWWLDAYVDFTTAQSPRVQEQLAEWLRWHRSTQLVDYAALLQRARTEVLAEATPAQACRWYDELAARLVVAYEQALPAAADAALALTSAQMEHIQHKFDKSNAEFRDDFLQPAPEVRLKESVKRTVDRAETLYGRLDEAQRERVARAVAASPFDPALWLAERQARQVDLLQTLRRLQAERATNAQMQAALRMLAERAQNSPRPAYRAYQQRLKQFNCEIAAQVHNATTPAQRQAAADTLKGWETDIRALAAEPPAR